MMEGAGADEVRLVESERMNHGVCGTSISDTSCRRNLTNPPFDAKENRRRYLDKLNEIDGVDLPENKPEKNPHVPIAVFSDDGARAGLFTALQWFTDKITNR